MLLRSSSTPFLHPFFLSSSFPSPISSLQLRRAFSDSHIPSLSTPSGISSGPTSGGGLRTELSLSVYNTFGGAPLASQEEPRHGHDQQHEDPELLLQGQQQRAAQPDHPEVPLFLARGLGIDRIASGFFTAGAAAGKSMAAGGKGETMVGGVEERAALREQDEAAAALDAQYKRMVDEQPGNALFLRNYAQFLHEVKGDARRAEEYYSRAMLADPGDGEIMSQYAKLVWEVHRDQERCLGYFEKSVQAAPQNSHVLAAYASFLWEQDDDDDDLGEGEQGTGGAGAPDQRAAPAQQAGQVRDLVSAAV
ncbi:uncharacterized protein C2845_PM15G14050 [Panicum miliaceum]|uniref:TmcB/TmcC TPR repeats domain-containing protein n=1 Tax=Panicum miliaceum TaxID=4540 RepID=A0A3L6Q9S2_PANMI|nr:uncharacterized protein C2845_PM15G14050 [Panicum miliaceum]